MGVFFRFNEEGRIEVVKLPFSRKVSEKDFEEKSKFIIGQTLFIDGGQSIDGSIESMNFKF